MADSLGACLAESKDSNCRFKRHNIFFSVAQGMWEAAENLGCAPPTLPSTLRAQCTPLFLAGSGGGVESRVSSMLGKHSTNPATPPGTILFSLGFQLCHLIVPHRLMKLNDTRQVVLGMVLVQGRSQGPLAVTESSFLASCSAGKAEWPPGQQLTQLLLFVSGP